MNKSLILFFLLLFPLLVNAQFTNVINSNRPGFSESPYSVGSGVYQFESSIFLRKAGVTPTFSNPEALGLDLLFRTSFFSEKLEFNLNTTLQNDKIAFKNIFESSYNETGLSKFTIGAKYLVYTPTYADKSKEIRSWKAKHSFDWKRWIPHVGVYAGLNFGSFLTDFHEQGGITPKFGVLLQNEFSNKLYVITNLFYNKIGSDFSEYSYIITGTYNFNDYWSGFAEVQQTFKPYEIDNSIGAGAAYLYNENLQINASIKASYLKEDVGFFTGIGVSYRINRHVDEFLEIDEFGNKLEDNKPINYDENKGFFGKLFSKIKGIFKKKDKDKVEIDVAPTDKKEDSEEVNPKRKRKKSLIDDIIKDDKKLKKKTIKTKKKASKKALRQIEKDKRKAEKAKLKEEKQKNKELEKLKKEKEKEEQEKLEEEYKIKKEEEKIKKEIEELEKQIKEEEEKEKKEKDNNNKE